MVRGGRPFRGGMRGHSKPMFRDHQRHKPYPQKVTVTHQVFDEAQVVHLFPQIYPAQDDALTPIFLKRSQELCPSSNEQVSVQNLVVKIENVFEGLILCSEDLEVGIEEVKMVGSYKKGTMLAGHPIADMVVVLKELPTDAIIEQLTSKLQAKVREASDTNDITISKNEGGFKVESNAGAAMLRCLVTTLPRNLLKADSSIHIDVKLLEGAIATIRHARWFEDNASNTTVRVLIRLLKDLRKKYIGFDGLTPWLIDLLAYRATMENSTRQALSLGASFRRVLRLLSSGLFLPGSVGILDPCEAGKVRSHIVLGLQEQDDICKTAQTLLRCFSHGGPENVLNLLNPSNPDSSIEDNVTRWNDVTVRPGNQVYVPQPFGIQLESTDSATADD